MGKTKINQKWLFIKIISCSTNNSQIEKPQDNLHEFHWIHGIQEAWWDRGIKYKQTIFLLNNIALLQYYVSNCSFREGKLLFYNYRRW